MDLDELNKMKDQLVAQWKAARQEEAQYRAYAKEMQAVYDEMKAEKDDMKYLEKNFCQFLELEYGYFQGKNFQDYQRKGINAAAAYQMVIQQIDVNLDRLNNEITRVENLALKTYGLVGSLASKINNVANAIQNYVN